MPVKMLQFVHENGKFQARNPRPFNLDQLLTVNTASEHSVKRIEMRVTLNGLSGGLYGGSEVVSIDRSLFQLLQVTFPPTLTHQQWN
jgi:hypothetical protein